MLKLFIDFDNTISLGDVGDKLFLRFGGSMCAEYDARCREGTVSAKECLSRKCEACDAIDRTTLDAFIDSQSIDPKFGEFVGFLDRSHLECFIVTDGLDYYVHRMLERSNVGRIPVFSNQVRLEPVDGGRRVRLIPSFPYDDEECTHCACCKRNVMLCHGGENDVLLYMGDGYSDQCPAQYADLVFAKAELQAFCQRQNISYYEFRSFRDVQDRLQELLRRKRIPRRHAALANREALYRGG